MNNLRYFFIFSLGKHFYYLIFNFGTISDNFFIMHAGLFSAVHML